MQGISMRSTRSIVSFNEEAKKYDGSYKEILLNSLKQGQGLHSAKKFEEAIEVYSTIITTIIKSNNPSYNKIKSIAYILRGNVFKEIGEFKLGLDDHNNGLSINPASAKYIRVY